MSDEEEQKLIDDLDAAIAAYAKFMGPDEIVVHWIVLGVATSADLMEDASIANFNINSTPTPFYATLGIVETYRAKLIHDSTRDE